MKLLIITPTYYPNISGNAIDVERISLGLRRYISKIMIITSDKVNIKHIKEFSPNIIHAYHAYKSSIAVRLSEELDIPFVLTLTGTDYNQDLKKPQKKRIVLDTINKASAITVFSDKTKKVILNKFPRIKNKIYAIKRDKPMLECIKWEFKHRNEIDRKDFVFTLIAGIRQVKNNNFPIKPLKRLHKKFPNIKFVMAGPVLDKNYFSEIKNEIKDKPWIKYIGAIPRNKIRQVYEDSDVIINCSNSEGLSNVIFEAMFLGKAILASDIPGNRFLVNNNITCLSYEHGNEEKFYKQALKLYEDKKKLKKLGLNAKKECDKLINSKEAEEYYKIYQSVVN